MSGFLGIDSFGNLALFFAYVILWTSQGILVHMASINGIQYNSVSAVFMQDFFKLIISVGLFVSSEGTLVKFWTEANSNINLFIFYFIPAALYAVYNNLTFVALTRWDPASYFVLIQFKIVVTAVLSIFMLGKKITNIQWIALVVIMLGSMFKEGDKLYQLFMYGKDSSGEKAGIDYIIICVQLFLSAFAGVYNEKLLTKISTSPNVQNVFMYLDGMMINSLFLFYRGELGSAFSYGNLNSLCSWNVAAIILNFSFVGVVTGFFVKRLGNVLKNIAGAIDLWTTALASSYIFGYGISSGMAVTIVLVSFGVWLYGYGAPSKTANTYSKIENQKDVEMSS